MNQTRSLEAMQPPIDHAEIAAFEMPKPMVGQQVRYYPGGHPTGRWCVATVVEVVHQHVRVSSADPRQNVSDAPVVHCNDPRIKSHIHVRKNGSWDFLPDFETKSAKYQELLDSVGALERKIDHVERGARARIGNLRRQLKAAGVNIKADEEPDAD